jgi:aspartate dehydrogenase
VGAVAACLRAVLVTEADLVVCSTGAFAEPELELWWRNSPDRYRVILPAGALGGLDLLTAVARSHAPASVTLITTKQPGALGVDAANGRQRVFAGSARQAIARYPKTANVAVTLSLATVGLDATAVEVVADPAATTTRHEVSVRSDLGHYRFEIENAVAPGSGARTSALTAWSAIVAIEQAAARRLRA